MYLSSCLAQLSFNTDCVGYRAVRIVLITLCDNFAKCWGEDLHALRFSSTWKVFLRATPCRMTSVVAIGPLSGQGFWARGPRLFVTTVESGQREDKFAND